MTRYYEEEGEGPYRRNYIRIEHHTMSEDSTEDTYEDSLLYDTASTKEDSVPGDSKKDRVEKLRT